MVKPSRDGVIEFYITDDHRNMACLRLPKDSHTQDTSNRQVKHVFSVPRMLWIAVSGCEW